MSNPTYAPSGHRDEIHPIPHPLGFPATRVVSDVDPSGQDAAYSIEGLFFLAATSDENPYQRQLEKVQKEQLDLSENPGDNSLQSWWVRSQTDWSGGAGQEYMEPIRQDNVSRMFWQSAGVDPFTQPGRVSLLPKATPLLGPQPRQSGCLAQHRDGLVVASGTNVSTWTLADPPVMLNTHTVAGTVERVVVAGGVAMLSVNGKVLKMPADGSTGPVDMYTNAGAHVPRAFFLKNRVLVLAGDKVWEIPGAPGTDADLGTKTPLVDLKDATWEWIAAASAPASILIAGNGDSGASIMAMTVDPQSGALPTLGAPTVVAELPSNERIVAMTTYLGSYVVLATTAGIRVGELGQTGLTYGPLLNAPKMTSAHGSFSVWNRFVQYPVDDAGDRRGGLVRLDLSEMGQDRRVPWATFTRVPSVEAVVDGLALGERTSVMISTTTRGNTLWYCPPHGPLDEGWLQTSQVRFGTLEHKTFSTVKVLALPDIEGTLTTKTTNSNVLSEVIGSLTELTGPEGSFRTGARAAQVQLGLRFDLEPDTGNPGKGPTLDSWSMRALPAIVDRGDQVMLPLLDFDFERDPRGVNYGYEGRAWQRWKALRDVVRGGGTLRIVELYSGAIYEAVAEECSFRQVAPPSHASGFGGIINLLLREV